MRSAHVIMLLSSVILVAVASVFPDTTESSRPDFALVGATIYPSPTEDPIRNGVVVIRDGNIVAVGTQARVQVPAGARILDCAGMAITAGFWNSHVHFFERKWANAGEIPAAELGRQLQDTFTRFGFTSVFDTGSMWANTRRIRDRVEAGEVPGPRIHSTGEALVAPHAMPPDRILAMLGYTAFPAPEIADASQAKAATRKLLEEGVDAIKVHLQPPPPPNPPFPPEAISATVSEAHRAGKLVFVHPNSGADVLAAVRAGVDIVAHTTPRSGPWDEATLAAMSEHNVALTPTLTLWKSFLKHDRVSTQEQVVNTAVEQLRAWSAAGGSVLFGTDLGAVDPDPSEEYLLMTEAGMSLQQILASLTTAPAERFGESKKLGRIAAGMQADLVVLRSDPAKNIRALTAVQYTLRNGNIIYRASQ